MRVCPTVVGPLWALGCPVCCRCFFTCWSHLPFWRIGSASLLCVGEPGGDCASGWGCLPRRSFPRWPSRSKRLSVASAPPALVVLEPEPEMLLSAQASPLVLGGPGPDRRSLLTPRPSAPVLGAPESLDWLLMSLRPHTPDFGVPDNLGRLEPPGRIDADASGCTRRRLEGRARPAGRDVSPASSEGGPRLRAHPIRHSSASSCFRSHFSTCCSTGPLSDALRGLLTCNFLSLHEDPAPQTPVRMDEWRAEFTAINSRSVLTGLGFLAMPFCKVAGVDVERDEVFVLVGSAAGAARLLLLFRTGSWL